MNVYIDTGIIVKSYVFETDSPEAIGLIEEVGDPLIFSHVHAIEIPNAIRLKRFRREITKAEEAAAIRLFRADIAAGRLAKPAYDLAEVFIRAERLSATHSGNIGTRSLDVLHVAAALECGCTGLASFDARQRKLAALAGLKVLPAKRSNPGVRGKTGFVDGAQRTNLRMTKVPGIIFGRTRPAPGTGVGAGSKSAAAR